ncbi:MAG TPA: hypothetical protein DCL61_09905 [Cyanobacteria bacterium UBA12227]|nr:hypothetical protein [Cyanobacteria bacterium UBA12227]HAX89717.1 hypothetical protein [Cyanobacteria bacterium UBA11370]HBY76652.1 hypothetical protein [Cyanobacteria bacterium UBA11148]
MDENASLVIDLFAGCGGFALGFEVVTQVLRSFETCISIFT